MTNTEMFLVDIYMTNLATSKMILMAEQHKMGLINDEKYIKCLQIAEETLKEAAEIGNDFVQREAKTDKTFGETLDSYVNDLVENYDKVCPGYGEC
jgi:hypothetical protein